MDATLAWTVVGSAAGVAGVAVAAVAFVVQARSGRQVGSKVSAELGIGQLDQNGGLYVEFMSGKTDIMMLPSPGTPRENADASSPKQARHITKLRPVNAIFVRNAGGTDVVVSRCHYVSDLAGAGFRFEPQPAASPWGDHLPKRLGPGEDAVLVHDLTAMRVFLNGVLLDHEVDSSTFTVLLTLGNGTEVAVSPSVRAQADMSQEELAASAFRFVRQEIGAPVTNVGWTMHRNRRSRRDNT